MTATNFDPCGLTPGGCAVCPEAAAGACVPRLSTDDPDPMTEAELSHWREAFK